MEFKGLDIISKFRFNNIEDIKKICHKKGLKLASIPNMADLNTILLLGLEQQYFFNDKGGILVGYDFGCDNRRCTGNYYSLDRIHYLNDIAAQFNSKINSEFKVIFGNALLVFQ